MDYLAAIRRDSDRFYATADGVDPARPVPSCSEWTVADLVLHLGEVHWFWGTDIEAAATGRPQPIEPDVAADSIGDVEVFGDQTLAQELVDRLNTT